MSREAKLSSEKRPVKLLHHGNKGGYRGIYSGRPEKLSPPSVEILPCFLGLLLLVTLILPVLLVLLQILPCFSIWTTPPTPRGTWPDYISLSDLRSWDKCNGPNTGFADGQFDQILTRNVDNNEDLFKLRCFW